MSQDVMEISFTGKDEHRKVLAHLDCGSDDDNRRVAVDMLLDVRERYPKVRMWFGGVRLRATRAEVTADEARRKRAIDAWEKIKAKRELEHAAECDAEHVTELECGAETNDVEISNPVEEAVNDN